MTAIAIPLPEDIEAVRNGLVKFARAEVLPRHATHRGLFKNPRRLYREDGRLGDEALALVREVRMAASEAGFYTMCVPESLGGAGLGMLAYYACWQELFRTCGPANWLMLYAISHWAFGPSRVLEAVTPRARDEILEPMMAGEKSMCFGLSEPGAGSDAARLQTQAVYDGEIWRINGRKIWTTNSPVADYCIIFARTESARTRKPEPPSKVASVPFWCQPTPPGFMSSELSGCLAASAATRRNSAWRIFRFSLGSLSARCTRAFRPRSMGFPSAGYTTPRGRWAMAVGHLR